MLLYVSVNALELAIRICKGENTYGRRKIFVTLQLKKVKQNTTYTSIQTRLVLSFRFGKRKWSNEPISIEFHFLHGYISVPTYIQTFYKNSQQRNQFYHDWTYKWPNLTNNGEYLSISHTQGYIDSSLKHYANEGRGRCHRNASFLITLIHGI